MDFPYIVQANVHCTYLQVLLFPIEIAFAIVCSGLGRSTYALSCTAAPNCYSSHNIKYTKGVSYGVNPIVMIAAFLISVGFRLDRPC